MHTSRNFAAATILLVLAVVSLVFIVRMLKPDTAKSALVPIIDASKITPVGVPTIDQSDPLDRGKFAYNTFCAHCHGYSGEGEGMDVNAALPDTLGYMPVPRHDSKGHTWMHPDQLIMAAIRQGLPSPLYRYPMPAMPSEALSDQQVADILLYIKQWWTPEQRAAQAALTNRLAEAKKDADLLTPSATAGS